jgi:hypothetical protein
MMDAEDCLLIEIAHRSPFRLTFSSVGWRIRAAKASVY